MAMHEQVMQAYLDGLRRLADGGGDVARVASVASFFVSRVDSLVDKMLLEKKASGADIDDLLGKAAVANARLAYERFEQMFDLAGPFGELASKGARPQRPLWASTSTKNPDFPDTKYVDDLIGPHTVNTLPPPTIAATLDHGACEVTIRDGLDDARSVFERLAALEIEEEFVTDKLMSDGVAAFVQSYDELLESLTKKLEQLRPVG
jgi:transaldolase